MSASRGASVPSYRLHKASGQARVTIDRRDHYLGAFGTDESRARYRRFVAQYLKDQVAEPASRVACCLGKSYFVATLCDEFLAWAQREYRTPDGDETGSVENVRQAMRALFEMFADVEASAFGPRSLVLLREKLARRGLARSTINDRVALIRRAFKWGTQEE